MQIHYTINFKILIFAMLGAIMTCSGYLIYVYRPISLLVKNIAQLKKDSLVSAIWADPPVEVFIKVYIFNVTNHEQFLAGEEALNFTEIGPFVYQEILSNKNATFHDNGTMSFFPRRTLKFRKDLSFADPKETIIISPNIPLIGITSSLRDASMVTNLAVSTITNFLGSKQFVNVSVHEYLWGYEDRLVTLANQALPRWINFPRFGIMDRLMALDNATNMVTINLEPERGLASKYIPEDERMNKYHIHRWNGSPGLSQWGYIEPENENETILTNSKCNMIEGTFDGTVFPPYMNKNVTFRMYRRAFCRPVPFNYVEHITTDLGFEGYRFKVDPLFLTHPGENPENACYCWKGKCLPKGLGSIGPCYYDIPIVLSQPHFYNADEKLREQVNGMQPDAIKHDSSFILHPEMGIPIEADLRIQINLDVGQTKYNSRVEPFNDLYLPLFWLELSMGELSTVLYLYLTVLYHILPVVQEILIYLLGIGGIVLLSGSAFVLLFWSKDEPNNRLSFKGEYSPIPILPTQYFKPEIRICK